MYFIARALKYLNYSNMKQILTREFFRKLGFLPNDFGINFLKKLTVILILLSLTSTLNAQSRSSVEANLKAKYPMAQYHSECGGWYFLSYNKGGQTFYGFADSRGNVVASDAYKYNIYRGFIELYLLDNNLKMEHDRWIQDKKQYAKDYNNYNRKKAEYQSALAQYKANYEAAEVEANSRWQYARKQAIAKAEAEAKAKANQQQTSSVGLAILSAVANGVSAAAAANSVKYEPYLNQVLGERNLTVKPSEPYNPEPSLRSEPTEGYYWKTYPLLQPCPYDEISYSQIADANGYANVRKDGKYGLVDTYLSEVFPCIYNSKMLVSEVSKDRFIIAKNNLVGVIDDERKTIIPFIYNSLSKDVMGYKVSQKGRFGIIDSNGKTIIPMEYESISYAHSQYKIEKNDLFGLADSKGNIIMPCEFQNIKESNGYLMCQRNNLWGIYSTDYEEFYPCQFQDEQFHKINNKLLLYTQNKGLWGIVDFESGDELLPNKYSEIKTINIIKNDTYFLVSSADGRKGLYMDNGIMILPCEFSTISAIDINKKSAIKVTDGKSVGVYTSGGISIINTGKYTNFKERTDGFFDVYIDKKVGLCDNFGEEIIPCSYDELIYNSDIKAFIAKKGRTRGLVDLQGKEVFPFIENSTFEYVKNQSYFQIGSYKYCRAIDYNGKLIVPKGEKLKNLAKKVDKYKKKNDIDAIKEEQLSKLSLAGNLLFQNINAKRNERNSFNYFAQNYVQRIVNEWQKRGEFEKVSMWQNRVNYETQKQKVYHLTKEAQELFIENSTRDYAVNDVEIVGKYDPDNETYCIKPKFYPKELLVEVPVNEAQEFKSNFKNYTKYVEYFVADNSIQIAKYIFTDENGKNYSYNNQTSLNHTIADVQYKFDAVEIDRSVLNNKYQTGKQTISTSTIAYGTSDVDINIPLSKSVQDKTFAIIIANENYENEKDVEYAYNDGQAFREYCVKALGIPENQVHFRSNATINQMRFEVNWLKMIAKSYNGEAKLIFYYAGHGMPDEETKDSYLLPVDSYSSDVKSGYKLSDLYSAIADMPAKEKLVLLDACFSGVQRSGEVLASARGIALKPKKEEVKGNMVVFSAASNNESAYSYKEKSHGLFTYFLLKKMQETQSTLDLGTLTDFVKVNVERTSLISNNKLQTPTVSYSEEMADRWKDNLIVNIK